MSKISEVVQRARAAFSSGKTRPLQFRIQQLEALRRMIKEHEKDIVGALTADLHKVRPPHPQPTARRRGTWAADEPVEKTPQTQQDECYIHSEPLGVVLIIGTWNYPFTVTIQPMVGAIAAGNAVVTKPSELSENMANLLATIIPQYLDRVRCSPGLWGLRNSAFLQQDAKPWVGPRTAGLSHGGEWSPGVRRGGLFDGGWLARVRRGRGLSRASSLSSRGRTCTR
uniref:Aldehyde dehydrogenase, dimeric NADP-preferring n=1 Tax=Ursus americanus TaxID=9643 RepID=A0A452QYX2_URSAM